MAVGVSLSEADFTRQVLDVAAIYGYETAHFRPALTRHGWRTPVEGTMGKGWPDWIFVREHDRRIIFAELKGSGGKVSPDQERVLEVLGSLSTGIRPVNAARVDVCVWYPESLDDIVELMR